MNQPNYYIIDFDSTFVRCEMLEELAKISLKHNPRKKQILQEIVSVCNRGMEGKIPFQESLRRRLQLIKANKSHFDQLTKKIKNQITPSILKNRKFFLENKDSVYIISGAFKEGIIPVTYQFGINDDHILANTFFYDKKGNITGVDQRNPLAYSHGKAKAIQALGLHCRTYVLGDGYTDYEIKKLGAADYFVAFTENVRRENVVKNADHVVNNFDEFLRLVFPFF
jgi:D-3-phosphoglycerate dehydrogenase